MKKTIQKMTVESVMYALFLLVPQLTQAGESALDSQAQNVNYLTFTAEEENSSITFEWKSGTAVSNSTDGVHWSEYVAGTKITLANVGDKVMFKGNGVTTFSVTSWNNPGHFAMTGKIAASGDVGTLTDGKGGKDVTLTDWCYACMFSNCTSLTTAPDLPAMNLAASCYSDMFNGCTSLTAAPDLPAMNLAANCYHCMFSRCTSLTDVPALPATMLEYYCYDSMFSGCTALVVNYAVPGKAWSIPADATEDVGWNWYMFDGTGGEFRRAPEIGKTYYIGAKKDVVGGVTLYRYEDKVSVSMIGGLTKAIADTLKDKAITNLIIGTGVTDIGKSAFENWDTLRDVMVGANCSVIGKQAFYKCRNLTNVMCQAEAITVDDYAFYRCNSLEGLSFLANPTWGKTPFSFYSGIYMKDGLPGVYAIPSVKITGYNKQTLMGTNDLSDPNSWEVVTEETKGNYHFFKIVLGE